jgi:MFS family permease
VNKKQQMTSPNIGTSGAWKLVFLLSGAFVINYIDRQVVFSIFPLLRHDLGFADAALGASGTAFTWTYSLMMPLSGRLADRFSRSKLVLIALMLWSLATLVTGLSNSVVQFLASRVAMGVCESLYVPAAIRLITQAHPGATRSRALAIHGFAQFIGITLGGWFGGWSAESIGWRQGFFVLAAIGMLYAAVLAWNLPPCEYPQTPNVTAIAPISTLVRSHSFLGLSGAFFSFCAILWMLYAWLPAFIYERYHLSLTDSGLTATVFLQSSSAVGVLLGGWAGDILSKRYSTGRFQVVIWGLLGCAPFAVAIFSVHSLLLLKLSACGFGLLAGSVAPNTFSALYDISGSHHYGLATGLLNTIGGVGAGFAILTAGLLKATLGMENLMYSAGLLAIICSILLFIVLRTSSERDRMMSAQPS